MPVNFPEVTKFGNWKVAPSYIYLGKQMLDEGSYIYEIKRRMAITRSTMYDADDLGEPQHYQTYKDPDH